MASYTLSAVIDWDSRYVLSWEVSAMMDVDFCINALNRALKKAKPELFNSDQGSQFTSNAFTGVLLTNGIQISMDGKGRGFDNIFIERFWRSLKYGEIYIYAYRSVPEAIDRLSNYFEFYNCERIHQSLDYNTPEAVYIERLP